MKREKGVQCLRGNTVIKASAHCNEMLYVNETKWDKRTFSAS